MSATAIIKDIKSKKLSPIYFLYGDEPFYIDAVTKAIEGILTESEKAFNQVILYGRDVDFKQVVDHARQYPMMASHRVVILKEAQTMRSIDGLLSYIENPSPQTVLLIAYKKAKLDKRTKFGKQVGKHAITLESKKLYQNKVPSWIDNYVRDRGYRIHPKASSMLAEFIGADLAKLSNELNKVCLSVDKGGEITYETITDQVGINRDFNIFEFRDALGQKNLSQIMSIAKYFGDNPKANPVQMILASLFAYYSQIFMVKGLGNSDDGTLARTLGVNPYFVKDYKVAARNYSSDQLKKIFSLLKQSDLRSKGIGARKLNAHAILQDLIFGIIHA